MAKRRVAQWFSSIMGLTQSDRHHQSNLSAHEFLAGSERQSGIV
jgi:hypothetical protein